MNIVILGAGSVGIQIARQLIHEGRNVVLIDRDEETVRDAINSLDCMVVLGEANQKATLLQAGADKADIFISVTESDELNIIACGLVNAEFQVKTTIARVRNDEYTQAVAQGQSFMGISHVINPDVEAAQAILRTIEYGITSDVLQFPNTDFEMRSALVQETSPAANKTLIELRKESARECLVSAILRDGEPIIPTGGTRVLQGDLIYLVGLSSELELMLDWLGKTRKPAKKIMVIGGSRVGKHVIQGLYDDTKNQSAPKITQTMFAKILGYLKSPGKTSGKSLTVIDDDHDRCIELSKSFPGILVRNGNVAEDPILEEDDLTQYDLIITVTENQELNLVTALYSKSLGAPRTIALVRKNSYLNMASHLAIDASISLNTTIVSSILRIVRQGSLKSVHSLSEGKLEFVEYTCKEGDPFTAQKIKDIRLPKNTLFLFITRKGYNLLPQGNLELVAGDSLMLITTGASIKQLEKLLEIAL